MRVIIIILLFFQPAQLFSQSFLWSRRAGGNDSISESTNWSYGIVTDRSGNAYITGSFKGIAAFGNDTVVSLNESDDLFIAKYDSSGKLVWVVQAGGTSYDEGNGIAIDDSANIYVTGHFYDSINFGSDSITGSGQFDSYIVKYDSSGKYLWSRKAGGPQNDSGWGICYDGKGSVYTTGFFYGTASFGTYTLNNPYGYPDIYLAKYDLQGQCLWARQAGGGFEDHGYSVTADDSGNVYVAGSSTGTASFGSIVSTGYSYYDGFLAKYDSSGNCLWVQRMGGSGDDITYFTAADQQNNIYVTGYFSYNDARFGSDTLKASWDTKDVFLAKYDRTGKCLWAKRAGGSGSDHGQGLAFDASGNVYVSGSFSNVGEFDNTFLPAYGLKDVFIAKYTPSGSFGWVIQAGGAGYDYGYCLAMDNSDYLVASGSYEFTGKFGTDSLVCEGENDVFITRLSVPGSGILENNFSASGFEVIVFPNPADRELTIRTSADFRISLISLYGVTGELIFHLTTESAESEIRIQLPDVPEGIYFLQISDGENTAGKKIIIN